MSLFMLLLGLSKSVKKSFGLSVPTFHKALLEVAVQNYSQNKCSESFGKTKGLHSW